MPRLPLPCQLIPGTLQAAKAAIGTGAERCHAGGGSAGFAEQEGAEHASKESSDVRPPGDTTCFASPGSEGALEELDQEPDSEEHGGGDDDELKEKDNWNQRDDVGVRIQEQVGAHHSCNSTAGADRGHD